MLKMSCQKNAKTTRDFPLWFVFLAWRPRCDKQAQISPFCLLVSLILHHLLTYFKRTFPTKWFRHHVIIYMHILEICAKEKKNNNNNRKKTKSLPKQRKSLQEENNHYNSFNQSVTASRESKKPKETHAASLHTDR